MIIIYNVTKIQPNEPKSAKWIHSALPAILLHGAIGSVYSFSLFVKPISEHIGKSTQSVQFAFSLAIFFLGMSAAFAGGMVEKNIKKSSLLSTILFCSGLIVTGIAVNIKSLVLLYIGYGFLGGCGIGLGYVSPVKTLMLWFKDNKGLATGISVCAFGFASTVASPIITYLTAHYSLQMTFTILACIYVIPMTAAHFLLRKPLNWHEPTVNINYNVKAVIKDKKFQYIWLIFFINITCGLAVISIASPMLSEFGKSPVAIAMIVGIMGLFNGAGRLVLSALSDKLKDRSKMYDIILGVSAVIVIGAEVLLLLAHNTILAVIALMLISAFYGAGFSCLPTLLSDIFGMKNISKIHSLELTAWSMAGLIGNQISETLHNITGTYSYTFVVTAILYLFAWLIIKKKLDKCLVNV